MLYFNAVFAMLSDTAFNIRRNTAAVSIQSVIAFSGKATEEKTYPLHS